MAYPDFYFFPTTTHPANQREWQGMMVPTVVDGVMSLSAIKAASVDPNLGMFDPKMVGTDRVSINSGIAWVSGYMVVSKTPKDVDLNWDTVTVGMTRNDLIVVTLNLATNEATVGYRIGSMNEAPPPVRTTGNEYDMAVAVVSMSMSNDLVKTVTLTDLRVVANAIGGVHRGPIQARPDHASSVERGELWYVTEPKESRGLYLYDDRQETTTLGWQPIVNSQIIASAQDTGGETTTQVSLQTGARIVMTNSDGIFHVPFPFPYMNNTISVVISNTDAQRGFMSGVQYVVLNKYRTGFTGLSVRYQFTKNDDFPNDANYYSVDPYAFPLNAPVNVDFIASGW